MSWTRLDFDTCAYNKKLNQSTSALTYTLDPNKFYNCNDCRIEFGVVGGNNVSISKGNLVDLENDLRNQNRLYSLCPEKKYLPNCDPNCNSNDGLPCSNNCNINNNNVQNLPTCNITQYKPRASDIGFRTNNQVCGGPSKKVVNNNTTNVNKFNAFFKPKNSIQASGNNSLDNFGYY
jgi:hypothetical protein